MPGKSLYNYGTLEQIKDVMLPLTMSCLMALIIYPVQLAVTSPLATVAIQVVLGAVVYYLICRLTKNEMLSYLLIIFRRREGKRKQ